jgi:hypothetical protein
MNNQPNAMPLRDDLHESRYTRLHAAHTSLLARLTEIESAYRTEQDAHAMTRSQLVMSQQVVNGLDYKLTIGNAIIKQQRVDLDITNTEMHRALTAESALQAKITVLENTPSQVQNDLDDALDSLHTAAGQLSDKQAWQVLFAIFGTLIMMCVGICHTFPSRVRCPCH